MAVIDRLGRRALLLAAAACMLIFMSTSAFLAYYMDALDEGDHTRVTIGWTLLGCICMYMCSFAIGWGGVPWVYPSEIFPMECKDRALSTSVFSQWAANFLIAYIVPQQVRFMKVSGTLLFYAACLAGALVYVFVSVPETKGVALEDMGQLFPGSINTACLATAMELGEIVVKIDKQHVKSFSAHSMKDEEPQGTRSILAFSPTTSRLQADLACLGMNVGHSTESMV